ncbi:hypothetical protein BACCOPRO_01185 [Phocaeicola coprophilus DSM 18228 = JCM 13818]|uniref:Uncharacterized protein n=1 Tax=Phocaeicola coprophilus DSM 18228 = JCM 13818 TaxID=547042 RepID=S0F650_9BACT|nr:hypothetical protein BACCOPRO_01185 [Phocaeicola coprophilus DSM 18228 = JCM 13818]
MQVFRKEFLCSLHPLRAFSRDGAAEFQCDNRGLPDPAGG